MVAETVECIICKTERVKALCVRVRGPHGLDYMCSKCFDRLSPEMKKQIRMT